MEIRGYERLGPWLTVILPAYNERDRLSPILQELRCFMQLNKDVIAEVIVVDDGSKDDTVESALAFSRKIPLRVERLEKNTGKWAAIHRGLEVAETDAVLIMDADGSAGVWELESLHKNVMKSVCESRISVFGSRFMKGSTVEGKSALRMFVSRGYRLYSRFLYWWATGRKDVDDLQCPFKLTFKSRLIEVYNVNRWAGDIELAACIQGKIVNCPVKFIHRAGSRVKTSTVREMFFDTLRVARRFRRFYKNGGWIGMEAQDKRTKHLNKRILSQTTQGGVNGR